MNLLEDARKKKKLTQFEIAQRLGIAVSTYNQYEKGRRGIPYDKVILIAEILGVDKECIFSPAKFTISKV